MNKAADRKMLVSIQKRLRMNAIEFADARLNGESVAKYVETSSELNASLVVLLKQQR